jgi:hypothetical protein
MGAVVVLLLPGVGAPTGTGKAGDNVPVRAGAAVATLRKADIGAKRTAGTTGVSTGTTTGTSVLDVVRAMGAPVGRAFMSGANVACHGVLVVVAKGGATWGERESRGNGELGARSVMTWDGAVRGVRTKKSVGMLVGMASGGSSTGRDVGATVGAAVTLAASVYSDCTDASRAYVTLSTRPHMDDDNVRLEWLKSAQYTFATCRDTWHCDVQGGCDCAVAGDDDCSCRRDDDDDDAANVPVE